MLSDPIIATLEKIVSLHDGIAEPAGEHILNVLLTENIASLLSLPEEVTFTTIADVPKSVFVTYHSEVLNKLSELLAVKGIISALGVKFNGHLKNTGFEKILLERLAPQNGLIRFLDADETMVNRAGLTHWSRQEGLIPSSRGSLAGSPVG